MRAGDANSNAVARMCPWLVSGKNDSQALFFCCEEAKPHPAAKTPDLDHLDPSASPEVLNGSTQLIQPPHRITCTGTMELRLRPSLSANVQCPRDMATPVQSRRSHSACFAKLDPDAWSRTSAGAVSLHKAKSLSGRKIIVVPISWQECPNYSGLPLVAGGREERLQMIARKNKKKRPRTLPFPPRPPPNKPLLVLDACASVVDTPVNRSPVAELTKAILLKDRAD